MKYNVYEGKKYIYNQEYLEKMDPEMKNKI